MKMTVYMLSKYDYFNVMIIQLTFISVGFWLLDLSHLITKSVKKYLHKRSEKNKVRKTKFVDTMTFELGFQSAYYLVIYQIALLYAIVCPYVTIFATLFFGFKYHVDKYNITFVYPKMAGKGNFMR